MGLGILISKIIFERRGYGQKPVEELTKINQVIDQNPLPVSSAPIGTLVDIIIATKA